VRATADKIVRDLLIGGNHLTVNKEEWGAPVWGAEFYLAFYYG
jgi:hypothetical protein